MKRCTLIVLASVAGAAPALGQEVRTLACLSQGETRAAVQEARVVPPLVAIRAARESIPDAEIVRAKVCEGNGDLAYVVMGVRPDGKFVRVTIEGKSGKVSHIKQ